MLATALAAMSVPPPAGRAAAPGSAVAVVDFYLLMPLSPLVYTPELLAADDLAGLVVRSGGGGMTVIPRATVRQAESALGWHGSDVLRFARLRELARALGADLLVLGRFDRLELGGEGTTGIQNRGGRSGLVMGFATIVVQVFDPRQDRIVSEVKRSGYEIGVVSARVGERLIQRLLEETVTSIMPVIGGGG
jgi:hypothetical protein